MNAWARLRMLVAMGLRNLVAHRIKSSVVGSLMFFGTFLVVLGSALLDSVAASMERSITNTLSGNAQVYSADAKDPFSLFPAGSMGTMDYGEIDDFPAVREALLEVDNVREVVPMGVTEAIVFGTPEIDRVIEELRDALDTGDAAAVATYAAHVRAIAAALRTDVEKTLTLSEDPDGVREDLAALDEVGTDAFWARLDAEPAAVVEHLDTRIAPLAMDGRLLYFRLLGTDLAQYTTEFEGFRIVEGELPPPGEPGVLLAHRFYERQVKAKVARDVDDLAQGVADGRTIASDGLLALTAERLPKQVQGLLYQLAPADGEAVRERLSAELAVDGDLKAVLAALLTMDDATVTRKHDLFYEVVAPRIRLYEAPVGSEMVLRSFTKSGYQRAAKVKVWGTFTFAGLERSDLAGATNLVDLDTFRGLYGRMTSDQQAELDAIRSEIGLSDLSRDSVEDALFGAPAPSSRAFEDAMFGEAPAPAPAPQTAPRTPVSDEGLALNAAVLLDDPSRTAETIDAMQVALDAAGFSLVVIDWQTAAGFVGQLLFVLRVVLTLAVFVIFLVTLVIINNTMVMATMERTQEIGTMRAIGAPRRFVVQLFVVETVALGFVAGGAGALAAAALVGVLGVVGIPAGADVLVLLFAGPRLYPGVGASNIVLGIVAVVGVSILSALYPAVLAARVPPVVAMSGREAS